MKDRVIKVIGMMSGTSADGLSLAYCHVDFKNRKIGVKKYRTYDYNKNTRNRILNARLMNIRDITLLHYELGKTWFDMLKKFLSEFNIKRKDVDLIASHGQTVYHSSEDKITYQIGEVEFISRRLDIPVAYDFRTGDTVYSGEGAPLIPFFDEFLFGKSKTPVCLLNIGGVSNISVVGSKIDTYGFDAGPGNSLMDWAMEIFTSGKKSYDKNGNIARKGEVDFKKIESFMKNNFFNRKPPKSIDREEFGKDFILKNFDFKKEKIENIMATLNYFTAFSIKYAVEKFVKEDIKKIVVSGGGVYNITLMENLKKVFDFKKTVESIETYSIHPLAKEAAGFALLGVARMVGLKSNCTGVTGAQKKLVLGKISLPDNYIFLKR